MSRVRFAIGTILVAADRPFTVPGASAVTATTYSAAKTPRQCTDIAAYLLSANHFPAGKSDLPADTAALDEILFEARK
jgi:hypothetical protein